MRWSPPSRFLTLAVLAGVVTLLGSAGVLPRWAGLPHLVALPPLDVLADIRLLVAAAPSYPVFLAGLVASFTVRVGVLALLLGGDRRHVRFAAAFYAVALVPALLTAVVQFSGQAGLYARLFWPGAIIVAATLAVLGPVPWTSAERVRTAVARGVRRGCRVEVLVPYGVALLVLGTLADLGGPAAAVVAVPLSAGLTLGAIRWLSAPPVRRPMAAFAAAGIVAAAIVAVVEFSRDEGPEPAPLRPEGSLVLMSGINSASGAGAIFEIDPVVFGFPCERTFHYSYAGPGPGAPQGDSACPILTGEPYVAEDTQRPLDELVEALRAQLEEREGPITLIAHSQAPWVAWQTLAEHGDLGTERLILLGGFPSSPLGYPPPGEPGSGRVGGDGLRLVVAAAQGVGFEFEADAPLAREILATPDASASIFAQPLPDGVEVLQISAVVDLPLKPDGPAIPGAETACAVRAAHPYLPESPETHRAIHEFTAGRPEPGCPAWRGLVGHAGRSLAIPPLHTADAG